MSVRQYIGARYIPTFADPIEWDSTLSYEPLTVVTNLGSSYVSRQSVPPGIEITNTTYWILWADYNAQIEAYREEVRQYNGRIEALEDGLPVTDYSDENTVSDAIEALETSIDSRIDIIEANSWVTNARIADGAVTGQKIQDGSVTNNDIADATISNSKIANKTLDIGKLSDATVAKLTRPKIAAIGDSFGNESGEWGSRVAGALGKTLVNKCTNGAGFTTGTKTFYQQLNEIISQNDMSEFSHIIVYGGVNDWNDASASVQTMRTAFENFYTLYNSISGVKPQLIFAFGNCGYARRSQYNNFYYWYHECMTYLHMTQMPGLVDSVCYWLFGYGVGLAFNSDQLHPSAYGQIIISDYLLACINGTYNGVHFTRTRNTNEGSGKINIKFDDGLVCCSVYLTDVPVSNNSYITVADFSSDCTTAFGTAGANNGAEIIRNAYDFNWNIPNGKMANKEVCFNLLTGTAYARFNGDGTTQYGSTTYLYQSCTGFGC